MRWKCKLCCLFVSLQRLTINSPNRYISTGDLQWQHIEESFVLELKQSRFCDGSRMIDELVKRTSSNARRTRKGGKEDQKVGLNLFWLLHNEKQTVGEDNGPINSKGEYAHDRRATERFSSLCPCS